MNRNAKEIKKAKEGGRQPGDKLERVAVGGSRWEREGWELGSGGRMRGEGVRLCEDERQRR
jgi:hypothetical protein